MKVPRTEVKGWEIEKVWLFLILTPVLYVSSEKEVEQSWQNLVNVENIAPVLPALAIFMTTKIFT